MNLRKVRQILKAFSDDNRLRLINLLNGQELTVTELCRTLNKSQSGLSKHLARLRLTGIVNDRRRGMNVYYYLVEPKEKEYRQLFDAVTIGLARLDIFKSDLRRLNEFRKKAAKDRKRRG